MRYKSFILLAFFAVSLFAEEAIAPDVRNVRWDMTKEQVETAENVQLVQNPKDEPGLFALTIQFRGYETNISYRFINNQLKEFRYWTMFDHPIGRNLYESVHSDLVKKYGEPALVIGKTKFLWRTPRTVIIQELSENKFFDYHILEYYAADYYDQAAKSASPDL